MILVLVHGFHHYKKHEIFLYILNLIIFIMHNSLIILSKYYCNFVLIILSFLKTIKVISSFVIISKNNPKKPKITNISIKAIMNENIVVMLKDEIKKRSNGFIQK